MTAQVHAIVARTETCLQPKPCLAMPAPDIETLLLVAQLDGRDAQEAQARGEAHVHTQARTFALAEARAAEAEAKEAEEKASKWLGLTGALATVATVAGAVAAIAAVVSTGGASAPIVIAAAGALLSASAPAVKQAFGDDAGTVALWGGVAMSLTGGGWSIAATRAAEASAGASAAKSLAVWIGASAHAAEGATRVAQGVSQGKEKSLEAESLDERAVVLERRATAKREQGEIDDVIARLSDLEASARRAIAAILSIENNVNATRRTLVAGIGRGINA